MHVADSPGWVGKDKDQSRAIGALSFLPYCFDSYIGSYHHDGRLRVF